MFNKCVNISICYCIHLTAHFISILFALSVHIGHGLNDVLSIALESLRLSILDCRDIVVLVSNRISKLIKKKCSVKKLIIL